MRKWIAVLAGVSLCAAMLAGCAATGASSAASSEAVSQNTEVAESTASAAGAESAATNDSAAASYDKAALTQALSAITSFEADSAGGSLKAESAAAGLVQFAAENLTPESDAAMAVDVAEWASSLSEEEKANLQNNWDMIHQDAMDIITDPAAAADLLSEAGVTTDFTTMDLTNAASVATCVNSLVNQSW